MTKTTSPRILSLSLVLLCGLVSLPVFAAPTATATATAPDAREEAKLQKLFADDARREQLLDPLDALYRGEKIDPALFAQLYTDTLDRRKLASAQASQKALKRIDRNRLGTEAQISYDVFAGDKRDEIYDARPDIRALSDVRPFNHFGGLHVEFPTLVAPGGVLPYESTDDYRRALSLANAFPQVLDNAIARFRMGTRTGVVESKLTVRNMIAQIDALLAQPVEDSPFTSAVRSFPEAVPAADREGLRRDFTATAKDRLYPAYLRLRDFLQNEYLPVAREQVGMSAMKGGVSYYRHLVEQQTTLPLDPEHVHQLGLGEVARIQREMDKVKTELGFKGTLAQFFDDMRTNPRYHPKTAKELADGFAMTARNVDALIPQYFVTVPKTRLMIQAYPPYREKFEAGGSYNQGSADATRPGTFFYNTYDLPSRFLTGITTLYLHEGIPGHHFQISLALENDKLPDFQRYGGNTAYVEGWALYAETLGYEMGFYKDPMQHWGTLDDEMLRAMRLVVDTGLHAKGWSRDQAITYMLANSGMGRSDATAEVERYIAMPAQALAYKVGALTIQRLRRKAEAALGPRFDLRGFHAQILGSGALPLPILEAKIDRWIAAQR